MSKHICDEEFPWCTEAAKAGEFCKLRVSELSPTQFATGKLEVEVRAKRMKNKYKKDPQLLHDYLRVRPVPIVVREKKFYLVDHHHLVRALYEALHSELKNNICVYVKVMENWTSLHPMHFWKEMFKMHWIYLFDHEGRGPQQLDATLRSLIFVDLAHILPRLSTLHKNYGPTYEVTKHENAVEHQCNR